MKDNELPNRNLKKLAEAVHDEKSFLDFLIQLALDKEDEDAKEELKPSSPYTPSANGWEHNTIGSYLEAAHAFAIDSSGGLPHLPPETNAWKRVAQILYTGKFYE